MSIVLCFTWDTKNEQGEWRSSNRQIFVRPIDKATEEIITDVVSSAEKSIYELYNADRKELKEKGFTLLWPYHVHLIGFSIVPDEY